MTQNANTVNYGGGGLSLKAVSGLMLPVASTAQPNTNTFGLSTPAGTYNAITMGDREQPLTDTYSVTLNQQLPWNLNLLIGYVGNNSRYLLDAGSNQTVSLDNVNAIPVGGLYKPNPLTGQVLTPTGITPPNAPISITTSGISTAQLNQYRPLNTALVQYGAVDVPKHDLFANYNGLQFGLTHQTGRLTFNINYTFSKALGIEGADGTGEPANPFNIYDNYGPENFDRRNIFNASYTFEVGSPVHNKLVGAFANGWEVSGVTNYQSGPDITAITSNPGFSLTGNIGQQYLADGVTANPNRLAINSTVYLGTPDVSLQPTIHCDPGAGLGKNQFINGACFGTPNLLQNGPYKYPYLAGPAFFNTDLSAQKNFNLEHGQSVQFRVAAFNFLNHPLTTFTGDFPNEYSLNLTNLNGTTFNQGAFDPSAGFGTAAYKVGRRIMELSVKYTF